MTAHTLFWIVACVLIADFITGFMHWFEDAFITPKTPILGGLVGVPNVEHHRQPGLMAGRYGFLKRNRVPFGMALIVITISLLLGVLAWQVVLVCALAALGNEVHEWNHMPKPKNALVAFIMDTGLVQTRRQHALHHKAPYDRYYCTLTNFTNAVLERINFWRALEWIFVNILQFRLQRLSPAREGF